MCGITGFIGNKGTRKQLQLMVEALTHRGPDAGGMYFEEESPTCGLGHRRLSIIDPTEQSNQPFLSHDKQFVISFNGEIYNYPSLRNKYDLQVTTNSDTEVLLEGFVKHGLNFINDVHGMFAFCILDRAKEEIWLFRDRIGIKPLYYSQVNGTCYFASELKSLLSVLRPEFNKTVLADFLQVGYAPGDTTFFTEINKLLPGNYIRTNGVTLEVHTYWQLESAIPNKKMNHSLNRTQGQLGELIEDAVQEHLVADVPVGTLLSGGVDSSLVTACAAKYSPNAIKTFSIGFKNKKFDESVYARQVAEYLRTDHYEHILCEEDAIAKIDNILKVYDEPFADLSSVPTMLVSEFAAEHVKVVLTGDGGDELFLGYGMYDWARRLSRPVFRNIPKLFKFLLRYHYSRRYKRAANYFDYSTHENLLVHIFSQEQNFFKTNEINELLASRSRFAPDQSGLLMPKDFLDNPMENQALFDLLNYLPEDLLVKIDRASMAFGLEARVPLLDHRVVEYALGLPVECKVHSSGKKYLLKKVLANYLPSHWFERPKWGFNIPMDSWLSGPLAFLIDKYLNKELVSHFNIVSWTVVNSYVQEFKKGNIYLYHRLWLLIILHKWLSQYIQEGDLLKS